MVKIVKSAREWPWVLAGGLLVSLIGLLSNSPATLLAGVAITVTGAILIWSWRE